MLCVDRAQLCYAFGEWRRFCRQPRQALGLAIETLQLGCMEKVLERNLRLEDFGREDAARRLACVASSSRQLTATSAMYASQALRRPYCAKTKSNVASTTRAGAGVGV